MKYCNHCGKTKSDSEFYLNGRYLRSHCKSCRIKINMNERKRRMAVLKFNGCAICGYNKCDAALEFHHVNPKDKEFSLGVAHMNKGVTVIANEVQKCVLLCANCHREIHNKLKTGK